MSLWQRILGTHVTQVPQDGFGVWAEPELPPATEEWDLRLRNFAKRCARELRQAGVPLWQSRYARDGKDSYRDAFWVISVDVEAAERRQWLLEHKRNTWVRRKQPEFGGEIRGDALILTPRGGIFSARVEMWFPPSGNHADGNLDSLFHSPDTEHLKLSPWAGLNVGRWHVMRDMKVYGMTAATSCSEFKSRFPAGAWSHENPGKGSSNALSKFMKSHRAEWPRYFDEFYGRY